MTGSVSASASSRRTRNSLSATTARCSSAATGLRSWEPMCRAGGRLPAGDPRHPMEVRPQRTLVDAPRTVQWRSRRSGNSQPHRHQFPDQRPAASDGRSSVSLQSGEGFPAPWQELSGSADGTISANSTIRDSTTRGFRLRIRSAAASRASSAAPAASTASSTSKYIAPKAAAPIAASVSSAALQERHPTATWSTSSWTAALYSPAWFPTVPTTNSARPSSMPGCPTGPARWTAT